MASIITRITTGGGATVKGTPLSNTEIDTNFINLNLDKLDRINNLSELTNAATARTNLGLGSIATQAANNVTITGGSISGISDLAVADGGTGASTAVNARANLGLVIGTDVQGYDADLQSIANLTTNGILVRTGSGSINASYSISSTEFTSLGVGTAPSGTTGEIRATNNITSYFSSDERLKENVRPISNALSIVEDLCGVRYDWKDSYIESKGGEDGYFVRKNDVGLIAQNVEQHFPELVAENSDGYKAVRYDRMVAVLIEAVKELSAEVKRLKGL